MRGRFYRHTRQKRSKVFGQKGWPHLDQWTLEGIGMETMSWGTTGHSTTKTLRERRRAWRPPRRGQGKQVSPSFANPASKLAQRPPCFLWGTNKKKEGAGKRLKKKKCTGKWSTGNLEEQILPVHLTLTQMCRSNCSLFALTLMPKLCGNSVWSCH